MNKRRYDEIIALVASVLFGIAVQYYHEVVEALSAVLGNVWFSHLVVVTIFLVFFRNIHGLIAYDVFIENTGYKAPYEEETQHILSYFGFGFFAALVLPYFVIYVLTNHLSYWQPRHNLFAMLYLLPLLIYVFWNPFWLCKLLKNEPIPSAIFESGSEPMPYPFLRISRKRLLDDALHRLRTLMEDKAPKYQVVLLCLFFPLVVAYCVVEKRRGIPCKHVPDGGKVHTITTTRNVTLIDGGWVDTPEPVIAANRPYDDILRWTLLWCLIDFFSLILLALCFAIVWTLFPTRPFAPLCVGSAIVSLLSLAFDYSTHAKFYFPLPTR